MDYHVDLLGGGFDTLAGREVYSDVANRCQPLGSADSGGGGDDVTAPPCQLTDYPAAQNPAGTGDEYSQAQPRTTVRLCSRMYWRRYQGPPPPPPDVPEPFQPPNDCTSGQAPVVAPARRFT